MSTLPELSVTKLSAAIGHGHSHSNYPTEGDFVWATEDSLKFLSREYLLPGQSLASRVRDIGEYAEGILKLSGFGRKLAWYIAAGWISPSTPIWTNFGTGRGLPISCNGSYVSDDCESIVQSYGECAIETKFGGGTSSYMGDIRPRGHLIQGGNNGVSFGSINFASTFDNMVQVYSQGSTRRGNWAGYWPITHGDIDEVMAIRSEGSPIQKVLFGLTITDDWMNDMARGDAAKRKLWTEVLEKRSNTGLPYLVFIDAMNRGKPDVYRDNDSTIHCSTLCSEIALPTSITESLVCCLSSMNVLHYRQWKDTDAVETGIFLLDAVMSDYIARSEGNRFLERPRRFSIRHRALGLGQLGWHSLLQSEMTPFDSLTARYLSDEIGNNILSRAMLASRKLADLYGEPELLKGYGRRNTTLIAIAPTKSSSFILGQASPGVEPYRDNYHTDDLQKGKFTFRNTYLKTLLDSKGGDEGTWQSILHKGGSVQHLEFLSENEKRVFRTFGEVSQLELVRQAASRQKWVDQAQSINLMIHPGTSVRDVNAIHMEAWKLGLKSLYYQHSTNASQEFTRNLLSCESCEA